MPKGIFKRSNELLENLKKRMTENNPSKLPEVKIKISNALKGIKRSEESKEKNRLAHLGKKNTLECNKKISLALIGNKYTLGYKHTKEWKKQHSEFMKGIKFTEEHKNKISKARMGQQIQEKNPNWYGGVQYEPYDNEFDEEFKNTIREREEFKCFMCHKHKEEIGKELHVHHIDYDKQNSVEWNCVALCIQCHSKTQSPREYWKKFFEQEIIQRYPKITKFK